MTYAPQDKIFAKVKGHPHWPSRINVLPPDVNIPKGKYPIFFYGTHEVYFLASKDIFPYDKYKQKYGVKKNKPLFQAGLREIEENPDVLLYGKDPKAEAFLAQFYKFDRSCTSITTTPVIQPVVSKAKRTGASSDANDEPDRPAKRSHVEISTLHKDNVRTPPAKRRKSSEISVKSPVQPPLNTSSTYTDATMTVIETDRTPLAQRPKRVSALRLKIRKQSGGGLKLSPAPGSSSPATPGSTEVVEATHVSPNDTQHSVTTAANNDLCIRIKSVPKSTPNITSSARSPVCAYSATATVTTTSLPIGAVSTISDQTRQRSTAIVTPLQRSSGVKSEATYESSTPSTSPERSETDVVPRKKQLRKSAVASLRRLAHVMGSKKNRERSSKKNTDSSFISAGSGSDGGSSFTPSPLASGDWKKTTEVLDEAVAKPSVTSPVPRSTMQHIAQSIGRSEESNDGDNTPSHKQKQEQQLRELSTEARLLLIDRSIKSSLIQGQEDVRTCIDRLELLNALPVSLSVLAKCWTVVETIRKCRRYKRSLEVKIAAQKVFNNFIQLYANADKYELELANAELLKHQQRHARQHSSSKSMSTQDESTVSPTLPPYTGPRSVAELFQVPAGVLADRRHLETSGRGNIDHAQHVVPKSLATSTSVVPAGVAKLSDTSRVALGEPKSVTHSRPIQIAGQCEFAIGDIPLPEESIIYQSSEPHIATSICQSIDASIQPSEYAVEDEFEVLDEYEEPVTISEADIPMGIGMYSTVNCSATTVAEFPPPELPHPLQVMMQSQLVAVPNTVISSYCSSAVGPYTGTPAAPSIPPFQPLQHLTTPYNPNAYPMMQPTLQYPFGLVAGLPLAHPPPQLPPSAQTYNPQPLPPVSYPVSIEATPPQAYVPHSLHPSDDPPPPYRPYIPSICESVIGESTADNSKKIIKSPTKPSAVRHQELEYTARGKIRRASSSTREKYHSSSSLSSPSTSGRSDPDRTSRVSVFDRGPASHHFRSPPHRARSPHALPHPLEHYQRCLVSALGSEDSTDNRKTTRKHTSSSTERINFLSGVTISSSYHASSRDQTSDSLKSTSNISKFSKPLSKKPAEDLETRIARLIGSSSDSSLKPETAGVPSGQSTHPLGSPPPPPPPLALSQRIICDHRRSDSLISKPHSPSVIPGTSTFVEDQQAPDHTEAPPIGDPIQDNDQPTHSPLGLSSHPPTDSCGVGDNTVYPIMPSRPLNSYPSMPADVQYKPHSDMRPKYFHVPQRPHGPSTFRGPRPPRFPTDFGDRRYPSHHHPLQFGRPRPRPGSTEMNKRDHIGRDFRRRRRSGRDDERDIYSMLGV